MSFTKDLQNLMCIANGLVLTSRTECWPDERNVPVHDNNILSELISRYSAVCINVPRMNQSVDRILS